MPPTLNLSPEAADEGMQLTGVPRAAVGCAGALPLPDHPDARGV
jgi:hypothetical protein